MPIFYLEVATYAERCHIYHYHLLITNTRRPALAETADRTAYDALIDNHLDNNTFQAYIRSNIIKMTTNIIKMTTRSRNPDILIHI